MCVCACMQVLDIDVQLKRMQLVLERVERCESAAAAQRPAGRQGRAQSPQESQPPQVSFDTHTHTHTHTARARARAYTCALFRPVRTSLCVCVLVCVCVCVCVLPQAPLTLSEIESVYEGLYKEFREEYVLYNLGAAALAHALPRMQVRHVTHRDTYTHTHTHTHTRIMMQKTHARPSDYMFFCRHTEVLDA